MPAQTRSRISRLILLLLGPLLFGLGCDSRPRAPALEDNAVYHNEREGFRFLVPDGWVQQAKVDLPAGPVKKERALVIYRHLKSSSILEASIVDMAEEDIPQHLTKKRVGTTWEPNAPPEKIDLPGGTATRHYLEGTVQTKRMAREVVVFRRGERVYFFNGIFPPGDAIRQAQFRQTMESLRWQSR